MKQLLLLVILTGSLLTATGQAGDLDRSFGKNGIVRTEFGSAINIYGNQATQILAQPDGSFYLVITAGNFRTFISRRLSDFRLDSSYGEKGYTLAIPISNPKGVMQPDGKIVLGGVISSASGGNYHSDFALARCNTDGSLDLTFSTDGVQTLDFNLTDDFLTSLALQTDGKIIVAGYVKSGNNNDFAVARFNPDGSLDNSFSGDGKIITDIGSLNDLAGAVALQADGKIVVAGSSGTGMDNRFAIVRYLSDGVPDLSFSQDGKTTAGIGSNSTGKAVAIQSDGKIVIGGNSEGPGSPAFGLIRLKTNGELDETFSEDGKQTIPFSGIASLEALAIQSDGKIITAGSANFSQIPQFAIARNNTDGSPDNTFSDDGKSGASIGRSAVTTSIALQADGKILAAGYSTNLSGVNPQPTYAVARYLSNGSTEMALEDYQPFGWTNYYASAIEPGGKILAAGWSNNGISAAFAVARYNVNGTPDNSFSNDGMQRLDFGPGPDIARAIVIQPDKKVLIAGFSLGTNYHDFALARLNEDGTPDLSFSNDSRLLTDFGGNMDEAYALALDATGKIIVGGTAVISGNNDFALARYTSDGTLDNTFSGDGKVVTDLGAMSQISSLFVQPDGKIVAVGTFESAGVTSMAIARYNTDGTPDRAFDGDGLVTVSFPGGNVAAYSGTLQPDGKIVVSGNVIYPNGSDFALARLNNNGSFDSSFSQDGKASLDMGFSNEIATSIALQADGRIIVAGHAGVAGSFSQGVLLRLLPDGTADNNFSGDGIAISDFRPFQHEIRSIGIHDNRLYTIGIIDRFEGYVAAYQLGEMNKPPFANGWLMKYNSPTSVLMNAWGSYDPEGGPIKFWWEKVSGPSQYTMWYQNASTPVIFNLVNGTYVFRLTVTDNQGATDTCDVRFTIKTNLPPIANGWLMKYYSPTSVLLNAWGSYDPEGGPIKFWWEKIAGPSQYTMWYQNASTPVIFNMVPGTYKFQLTVTDQEGATGKDTVTITINPLTTSSANSRDLTAQEGAIHAGALHIYPNPVKDKLNFRWAHIYQGSAKLSVTDMSGKIVKEIIISKKQFDFNGHLELNGLKPGIYHFHITEGIHILDAATFMKE